MKCRSTTVDNIFYMDLWMIGTFLLSLENKRTKKHRVFSLVSNSLLSQIYSRKNPANFHWRGTSRLIDLFKEIYYPNLPAVEPITKAA